MKMRERVANGKHIEVGRKSVQGYLEDYGRRQPETIPRRGDRRGSMAGYSGADGI